MLVWDRAVLVVAQQGLYMLWLVCLSIGLVEVGHLRYWLLGMDKGLLAYILSANHTANGASPS